MKILKVIAILALVVNSAVTDASQNKDENTVRLLASLYSWEQMSVELRNCEWELQEIRINHAAQLIEHDFTLLCDIHRTKNKYPQLFPAGVTDEFIDANKADIARMKNNSEHLKCTTSAHNFVTQYFATSTPQSKNQLIENYKKEFAKCDAMTRKHFDTK